MALPKHELRGAHILKAVIGADHDDVLLGVTRG
jgi:hypothetical protein